MSNVSLPGLPHLSGGTVGVAQQSAEAAHPPKGPHEPRCAQSPGCSVTTVGVRCHPPGHILPSRFTDITSADRGENCEVKPEFLYAFLYLLPPHPYPKAPKPHMFFFQVRQRNLFPRPRVLCRDVKSIRPCGTAAALLKKNDWF